MGDCDFSELWILTFGGGGKGGMDFDVRSGSLFVDVLGGRSLVGPVLIILLMCFYCVGFCFTHLDLFCADYLFGAL